MKRRYIFKASRYLSRLKNEEGIMPKIIMIRFKTCLVSYTVSANNLHHQSSVIASLRISATIT